MHIVLATTVYPPDNGWGGIGTYLYHMSRGLVALGHRVTVVCGFGDQPRESQEDGVTALRLLDTRCSAASSPSRQVCAILEQLIKTESVDVIEFPEYEALGLDFQRAHPDFPVVVKLHGDTELCLAGGVPGWKRLLFRLHMPGQAATAIRNERETVRRASIVISPSRWLIDECLSRGWQLPREAQVVPNPILRQPASPSAPNYSGKTVIWLGRLDLRKGADLLPSIAAGVWQRVPEAQFHVIGQALPHESRTWSEWIEERVPVAKRAQLVFHGGLPADAVLKRLSSQSLAVFASTWENFPYAQLECMLNGMACVNASVGGASEMGVSGESLINVPRTASRISSALITLLEDNELRERVGRAAAAHVRTHYSATTVATEMSKIYSLAGDQRRRSAA